MTWPWEHSGPKPKVILTERVRDNCLLSILSVLLTVKSGLCVIFCQGVGRRSKNSSVTVMVKRITDTASNCRDSLCLLSHRGVNVNAVLKWSQMVVDWQHVSIVWYNSIICWMVYVVQCYFSLCVSSRMRFAFDNPSAILLVTLQAFNDFAFPGTTFSLPYHHNTPSRTL